VFLSKAYGLGMYPEGTWTSQGLHCFHHHKPPAFRHESLTRMECRKGMSRIKATFPTPERLQSSFVKWQWGQTTCLEDVASKWFELGRLRN
jgi:hypothetical protein